MPKRVDHAERRRQIAEAVLRLAAKGGMDAVSLRDVAADAGVSMGMVQHYFPSKDRMLLFACGHLLDRTRQRIQERIAALPAPRTIRATLRTVFLETLPLDEQRRAGTRVWLAFLARAAVEPELATFMRDTWIESHAFIAGQIQIAQERGELPLGLGPDREATVALAFVDGLVSHILFGHYSSDHAISVVDDYLERWFMSSAAT